ncbi:hypothetical protein [uncultured Sphaerochaeta sp.]|uniref:hypothetical protein n=1 Tax=uncultured Sphaerochaeta sp. TaxID=886478 RepID=UPI0026053537|nr:hypothetical protein [uncultured Sphaerochaeta sp.]
MEPATVGKILLKGTKTRFVTVSLERTHTLDGEAIPESIQSTMKLPPHEDFLDCISAWAPHVVKTCELRAIVRTMTATEIIESYPNVLEDIEVLGIELSGNTVDSQSVVIIYKQTGYDGLTQKKKSLPIRFGSDISYTHREEVADLVSATISEALMYQNLEKYDDRMWKISEGKRDPNQLSLVED